MPVKPMPIAVRGVVFENARACAAHFGIAVSTVHWHLSQGTTDTLGLGNRSPRRWAEARRQSIIIYGVEFGSKRDASLWLGCNGGYASNELRRYGEEEGMARLELKVKKKLQDIQNASLKRAMEADSSALKRRLRDIEVEYKKAVRSYSPAAADAYYKK